MDSDKIAKIINSYNGDDIPESLREVCIDYFCNNSDDSSSESESTDRISDVLATALEDQQPTTDNEDQITEINLSEIPIVFEGDEYDFDDPGLGNPVEEVEDFDLPDIPVIGSENEVNAEFVHVWEPIEYEERMIEDDATIRAFKVEGCCSKKCCDKFTFDELITYNLESRNLYYYIDGSNLLDVVVLGQIRSMCRTHDEVKTGYGSVNQERKRNRILYSLRGENVCEKLFLVANAIKIKRFKRLLKIFKENGLIQPMHGNVKRTPKHVCSFDTIEKVVSFIRNYAEEAALFMPGRLAQQYNIVKLLPSSDSKIGLYRKYKTACEASNERAVGKSLFKQIWLTFCPDVVIMRPKSDLCAYCQKNYTSHEQLRGATEEEKEEFFRKCQEHLQRVNVEREAYKKVIKDSIKSFDKEKLHQRENGSHLPNTYEGGIHYSFDFAQQIHIPFDSLQPGPIYFLTPFKVGLFGVMNDTTRVQHNFLLPESCQVSKGANAIASYLHYYFENHGLGEQKLFLHADNCVSQNKNNIVMSYLNWRVLRGLNNYIMLSFLPVGHTKFDCDWAFGLFKQKVRVEKASSLQDVASIVVKSSPVKHVNQPVIAGTENGDVIVPIYDWQSYFAEKEWKVIPNITKFNHFCFQSSKKGQVLLQTISDGPKTSSTVSSADPLDVFPNIINPTGLTYKRKLYLYEKIRPFCPKEHQDLLCPHPGPPSREDGNKSSSKPSSPGNNKTPSQKRKKLPAILKSKGKKVKKIRLYEIMSVEDHHTIKQSNAILLQFLAIGLTVFYVQF